MKKIAVVLIFMMTLGSVVFAAGSSEAQRPEEKTFTLKISTAANPNQTHTLALHKFKEALEASTDRIKVQIFDSSTLFRQDANITAMIRGNLEMCYTDASWLSEFMPSLEMFTAAYLYRDYDHMNTVLSGEIGAELFDSIAKEVGVRPLGVYYLGSRILNLRQDKEITSRADMAGVQLRMPNSETWLYMGRALGANPVAMGFNDVYLALQTGAIDAQDNPLPTVDTAKFYEVTRSITITNHSIGTVWLAISESVWQQMDSELQAKVMDAVDVSRNWNDQVNLQHEAKLVEQFIDYGLKVYTPDMTNYKNEVFNYYLNDPRMSNAWDLDLLEKILSSM